MFFKFFSSFLDSSYILVYSSILFLRSSIIFTIITLNSFSSILPIFTTLSCSSGVLSYSVFWNIFLCHLISLTFYIWGLHFSDGKILVSFAFDVCSLVRGLCKFPDMRDWCLPTDEWSWVLSLLWSGPCQRMCLVITLGSRRLQANCYYAGSHLLVVCGVWWLFGGTRSLCKKMAPSGRALTDGYSLWFLPAVFLFLQWATAELYLSRRHSKTHMFVCPKILCSYCFSLGLSAWKNLSAPSKSGISVFPSPVVLPNSGLTDLQSQIFWGLFLSMLDPQDEEPDMELRTLLWDIQNVCAGIECLQVC